MNKTYKPDYLGKNSQGLLVIYQIKGRIKYPDH